MIVVGVVQFLAGVKNFAEEIVFEAKHGGESVGRGKLGSGTEF